MNSGEQFRPEAKSRAVDTLAGFFNILKPPGMTSHDVVAAVRRRFPRGLKVGHCGTLDPPAAGVLPVAFGWATRLISHVPDEGKAYRAEVDFGWRSDTLDAAGVVQPGSPPPADLQTALAPLLAGPRGTVMQVPPQVSALRQDGQRAYDRARRGEEFELPARPVRLDEVEWINSEGHRVWLNIRCGPGFYVRSLARDLGESLGCGALLRFLLRSQSGPFTLDGALRLEELDVSSALPWNWPWRDAPVRALEVWPPVRQPDGFSGLGSHSMGAALFVAGEKVWAREGSDFGL